MIGLVLLLIVVIGSGGMGLILLDKLLHYREYIRFLEDSFANQGLRLATPEAIAAAHVDPMGVLVGGSLPRLWFLPPDLPYPVANLAGLEEPVETTLARFDETAIATGARFAVVNAGFCDLFTAIRQGRDVDPVLDRIVAAMQAMLQKARSHGVRLVLTTLSPVRSRFLFPYLRFLDYSSRHKKEENAAYRELNRRIRALCERERVPLIDFYSVLADPDGRLVRDFSLPDGEHLNLNGYQRLGAFFSSELKRIFPAGSLD
jgi:lysophospholipase L1-like esterase